MEFPVMKLIQDRCIIRRIYRQFFCTQTSTIDEDIIIERENFFISWVLENYLLFNQTN